MTRSFYVPCALVALDWVVRVAGPWGTHVVEYPSWITFGQPLFLLYGGSFAEGLLGRFRQTSYFTEGSLVAIGRVTCETRRVEYRPNGPNDAT